MRISRVFPPACRLMAAAAVWIVLSVGVAPPAHADDRAPAGGSSVVSGPMECSPDLPLPDRMHCENVRLDAADAALNTAYQALLALLDERGRERLVEAQRAWLAFRDRDFELRAAVRADAGQQGLLEQVRRQRRQTEERTAELEWLAESVRARNAAGRARTEPPPRAPAQPDAEPVRAASDKALALLLGPHALRLHWLGETATGRLVAEMRGRALVMAGSQETPAGFVRVAGWVESVSEDAFVLDGEVVTRVDGLNDGKACARRGRMEFRRHSGRPFWRLQSHVNPCSGVTDYVDVFLAGHGEGPGD